MNHLLRGLAPISDDGWRLLDEEARSRLAPALGARRLVDFAGPHGWSHSATNLGRTQPLPDGSIEGVSSLQRRVLALVELRADFTIPLAELQAADRGAPDADLAALDVAARSIAKAENMAVMHGWGEALQGLVEASPLAPVALADSVEGYPKAIAAGIQRLLDAGIAGPYGLALGESEYALASAGSERGGYPVLEHLGRILGGGPIVWTPGLSGGAIVSQRGGDFLLDCGQDLSLGYASHDAQAVSLYLQESISFQAATPEAAVALSA